MRKRVSCLGWVHWILAHRSFELYRSDMRGLEREEMTHRGKLAQCQETWLQWGWDMNQWLKSRCMLGPKSTHGLAIGVTSPTRRPFDALRPYVGISTRGLICGNNWSYAALEKRLAQLDVCSMHKAYPRFQTYKTKKMLDISTIFYID